MNLRPLSAGDNFSGLFSMLLMDNQGQFVRTVSSGREEPISPKDLPRYLYDKVVLPKGVTDVFVWVHGWQTDRAAAKANAMRMFNAIEQISRSHADRYPHLREFMPGFLAVSWPSTSWPGAIGYNQIRNRAKEMTEKGFAEFFLASLLGYLKPSDADAGGEAPKTLRSSRGFYVHCLGHSFGGRFLTAAIAAATSPKSEKTLSLLRSLDAAPRKVLSGDSHGDRFKYEVDSAIVFQMAAPNQAFGGELRKLLLEGPLRGPFVATHSKYDRANCLWHRATEWGQQAIGCTGAREPKDRLTQIRLQADDAAYDRANFPARTLVNVDANWLYKHYRWLQAEGAHSDFWYEESIHLILSVANASRGPLPVARDSARASDI